MLMRLVLVSLSALTLVGCATSAQIARAEQHDYGATPPPAWRQNARRWLSHELREPASAEFRMGCPVKVYVTTSPLSSDDGAGISFTGWGAQLQVDSASALGGRTGFVSYVALMSSDGAVSYIGRSLDADGWGGPRFNVVKGQDTGCVRPVSSEKP